jgi:hypothetical protein
MNEFAEKELTKLSQDFTETIGRSFAHFFCPILFCDEDTELCQAHIINEAFANSTRESTVQRKVKKSGRDLTKSRVRLQTQVSDDRGVSAPLS